MRQPHFPLPLPSSAPAPVNAPDAANSKRELRRELSRALSRARRSPTTNDSVQNCTYTPNPRLALVKRV